MSATKSEFYFSEDRSEALAAIESIAGGKGWCNILPRIVDDDVPDIHINFIGWTNRGITKASFVTEAPKNAQPQPSSLGVLHSGGRVGRARVTAMLEGAPYSIRQDHSQRGLILIVPPSAASSEVLDVMCRFSSELCEYERAGGWRFELFEREERI
ncbi:MAG TPA: hypothetical protein VGG21_08255 [Acidimicrobiales bacterium]